MTKKNKGKFSFGMTGIDFEKFSISQIITGLLWLETFVFLLAIVAVAAFNKEISQYDPQFYGDVITGIVLVFSILLITSIFFTVICKYREKRQAGN